MSQSIDREGDFRGQIVSYGIFEAESRAVAIGITVAIEEMFNRETGEWENWRDYDVQAEGNIWIIKKTSEPNEKQVAALVEYAGWDGSVLSIENGTWKPTPCGFSVQADAYKDQTRYRIAWVKSYNATPGGGSNVDSKRAKELQSQYGSTLRAIAGNVKRNQAKPTGKPLAPPAAKPAPQPAVLPQPPAPHPEDEQQAIGGDDSIPF